MNQPEDDDMSQSHDPVAPPGEGEVRRLAVGSGGDRRDIAFVAETGATPGVVWLSGFRSDMRSTKATALADWARARGRACLRFDYSGHGESEGRFEEGTIGRWLADAQAVFGAAAPERSILVGSSMGGWLALLLARALASAGLSGRLAGIVLIAPAVDFTETLMWDRFPAAVRRELESKGVWYRTSPYAPEPTPVTLELIREGRNHLLFGGPIRTGCPVHILQGMEDPDVPWRHAMTLVEHLAGDPVTLTLIKDGDHRLSRDSDLHSMLAALEGMA
jgi:pimeloyl-ACP methyl ester carboxylesterase